MMDNKNKRYRLHQKIKNLYRYCPYKRTIYVSYNEAAISKYALELKENYNYSIQYEIPCPN